MWVNLRLKDFQFLFLFQLFLFKEALYELVYLFRHMVELCAQHINLIYPAGTIYPAEFPSFKIHHLTGQAQYGL